MAIARHLTRPTRTAIRKQITCRPYLVLLPVGLAVPPLSPEARCALTAPFQPCSSSPLSGLRRSKPRWACHAVVAQATKAGGVISVALSLRSPWADVIRHRAFVEPGLSSMLLPKHRGHP